MVKKMGSESCWLRNFALKGIFKKGTKQKDNKKMKKELTEDSLSSTKNQGLDLLNLLMDLFIQGKWKIIWKMEQDRIHTQKGYIIPENGKKINFMDMEH